MYPIKFENLYYDKIWGGRDFESFRDNLPAGNIGESWDISCRDNGMGIVKNGYLKGKSFEFLIDNYWDDIIGKDLANFNGKENITKESKFPLLVKLINSKEKLSVQVHPNDQYANYIESCSGKTEFWYVVDAKEGASLIVGTRDCDKESFKKAILNNETEKYLNKIQVKKGDSFIINSGLVHAICEGVIIAEIQQNCDITYRIYDYGRKREIHVDKALDVIDFGLKAINTSGCMDHTCCGECSVACPPSPYEAQTGNSAESGACPPNANIGLHLRDCPPEPKTRSNPKACPQQTQTIHEDYQTKINTICKTKYFNVEKYLIKGSIKESSNINKFFIFTCVDGEGSIIFSDENKNLQNESIIKGESILIPAKLGDYKIEGDLTLLKTYVH